MLAALGMLAGFAVSAHAEAKLPITGAYGNAEGCRFHKDGTLESDDMLLLTADSWQTVATGCTFLQVLTDANGNHLATGICGHEGDESLGAGMTVIAKASAGKSLRLYDEQVS